ncbi:ZIP zinc transporter-domain-containing protein [Polychytrium aggregatum]|uniref:ZIP zinc transporter-domain-containing protein n=1 Tax=Polychytrium aggregatum TaxID=110093 RepID=UPI0022FE5E17|nr:ZIP zinc transporter-domain-containing protein [Polychytrium aggregatum]KAI9202473.1 ZIP zinc transporter-domain-containing protein [Polychytrium aggregatum]
MLQSPPQPSLPMQQQQQSFELSLFLSLVAGLGTALGGLVFLLLARTTEGASSSSHSQSLLPLPSSTPLSSQSLSPHHKADDDIPISPKVFGRLQALSAGVMLLLSKDLFFAEALPVTGWSAALFWFAAGGVVMLLIEKCIHVPEPTSIRSEDGEPLHTLLSSFDDLEKLKVDRFPDSGPSSSSTASSHHHSSLFRSIPAHQLLRTAMVTFIAMGIHNLPEGISVAISTTTNLRLGMNLCFGIMLHNIIEGMVVACSLWYALKLPWAVLVLCLFNGLMEPIGVVAVRIFGIWDMISQPGVVERVLAGVAGVMAGIALSELIPGAAIWIGKGFGIETFSHTSWRRLYRLGLQVALWTLMGALAGAIILKLADVLLAEIV